MAAISFASSASDVEAVRDGHAAHSRFTSYLERTKNTICGRHPIGVLLAAVGALQRDGDGAAWDVDFVRYEQSSACSKPSDSSVSYASATCRCLP